MARHTEDDDWDEDDEDADGEDGVDDGDDTVPCPYCGRPIFEDLQRCPYCETYISGEDAAPVRKPWWIIIGALLCLFVMYFWIRYG